MTRKDLNEIMRRKCYHRGCKEKPIAIIDCKYYCKEHREGKNSKKNYHKVARGPVY